MAPIHDACNNNSVSEVKRLLDQDDNLKDLGDQSGWTPLIWCAVYGRLECLKLLGKRGADVNRKDNNGYTAAHHAAVNGRLECLQYLVEHCGADATVKSNYGKTPLDEARGYRKQSCVEYLEGVIKDNQPIHEACRYKKVDEVKAILKSDPGAKNAKGWSGYSPLHFAAGGNRAPIVQLLCEASADVNAKNNDGDTPLHIATRLNHTPIVQLLIEASADVNAKNNDGDTPLHIATVTNRPLCIQLLHQGGANANTGDKNGDTPLHFALASHKADLAILLITKCGADPEARNNLGVKAMCNATSNDVYAAVFCNAWAVSPEVKQRQAFLKESRDELAAAMLEVKKYRKEYLDAQCIDEKEAAMVRSEYAFKVARFAQATVEFARADLKDAMGQCENL